MCGPRQVWPLRSECCGRGVPTKVVCAECMKMCCLGGKNSVVKGLTSDCSMSHGRWLMSLKIQKKTYNYPKAATSVVVTDRTCT